MYLSTSNIEETYNRLKAKGAKANDIKDDLYGPGSGVKWFDLHDPDGNLWQVAVASIGLGVDQNCSDVCCRAHQRKTGSGEASRRLALSKVEN